ncbi:MAG TPA: toll/interleukin-1 receptor domain-containing protein [Terracidiphilus sp.]|nr:toll/interleukin-1 receptor domain-containing protein [Terracidiphilus sp.]
MGRAIFISYRRDDSEGEAGRLFDDLTRTFGENSVFMDVTDIKPGIDFRKAIDDNVATCGVLLAVIGPSWATISNGAGERRLEDASDFVRLEIASALAREIAVIPVLVHGAQMPHPDQLPENLKDFAFRNSVELTHVRWNSDVQLLIKALGQYVASPSKTSDEPVHATVTVQLPPANPPAHVPATAKATRKPLFMGIAIGAALVVVAIILLVVVSNRRDSSNNKSDGASITQTAVTESSGDTGKLLVGTWTNSSDVARNGLERLQISNDSNGVSIHAWGKCEPDDCDWGSKTAAMEDESAKASWTIEGTGNGEQVKRIATIIVKRDGASLAVSVENTFSTGRSNKRQFEFVRAQ